MFGDKSYLFSSEIARTEKQMNLKINKNFAHIFFIIFSPYKFILFLTNHDEYNSN